MREPARTWIKKLRAILPPPDGWRRGLLIVVGVIAATFLLMPLKLSGQSAGISILAMIILAGRAGGPIPGALAPPLIFAIVRAVTRGPASLLGFTLREVFNTALLSALGAGIGVAARNRRRALALLQQHSALLEQQATELRRSNQDLEEIAYAASHDLQEPLRAVSGYCQLLQMEFGDNLDEAAREYIRKSVDGIHRMQALIKGLLVFSQMQRKGEFFERVDCEAVLQESLANLSTAIEESGATISSDALPAVPGNKSQLVQVFQNLIGNAIKYRSDRPPHIQIRVERRVREWLFSVQDNGIGIPVQFRSQLFTIFKRLHNREQYPGTGLGLALCKRIIERHGGTIWIEGDADRGSTFSLTLPADFPVIKDAPMISGPVANLNRSNSENSRRLLTRGP
jgi:signal transduction histidine kinase